MKALLLSVMVLLTSCSTMKKMQKIRSGEVRAEIHVTEDVKEDVEDVEVVIDSIRGTLAGEPIIMNAIRDDETGEMVATDVISASKVTARFRNVAERAGTVSIEFDVTVPAEMSDSRWQLKLYPRMSVLEDTVSLEPVFITGAAYREEQLRGYGRYEDYVASILTDTADLVHLGQYGIFFQRQNLFDVTAEDALHHYRRRTRVYFNERRKERKDLMFEKYVRDPIITEGIRLDTVLTVGDGDFVYRYRHTFRSLPDLKKVMVALDGEVYENGRCVQALPFADGLTYYISTLASLADMRMRYTDMILERRVSDNTKALIDFKAGSTALDPSFADNMLELDRIKNCIMEVYEKKEYELDSLVISTACYPKGPYTLAEARSESVKAYLMDHIPPSWHPQIRTSVLPEKSYPKLRCVNFEFNLSRKGMSEDTVHVSVLDTVYMAGLEALKSLDYKRAVELLRPYKDYNTALALVSADYNHSALEILNSLDDTDARVCYLKSLVLCRLGIYDEGMKYFELSIAYDPSLEFRANLDPEMSEMVRQKQNLINY